MRATRLGLKVAANAYRHREEAARGDARDVLLAGRNRDDLDLAVPAHVVDDQHSTLAAEAHLPRLAVTGKAEAAR